MLIEARYKKGRSENGSTSKNFYKYSCKEVHMINQCEGFHNKVI